jgi:lipopolysaccharide assembly protein A
MPWRLLLLMPLLLVLVVFALSNPQIIHFGFWLTGLDLPLPASLAVLAALALGILFGAVALWLSTLCLRHRLRRAEQVRAALETELHRLKANPRPPVLPPPA